MKTKEELTAMTKTQIDEYGEEIGIKLDRRRKKDVMIEELLAHQETLKPKKATKKKVSKKKPTPKKGKAPEKKPESKPAVKSEPTPEPEMPANTEAPETDVDMNDKIDAWIIAGLVAAIAIGAIVAIVITGGLTH